MKIFCASFDMSKESSWLAFSVGHVVHVVCNPVTLISYYPSHVPLAIGRKFTFSIQSQDLFKGDVQIEN